MRDGIPVVAEAGPSGGYSLLDFTLKPLPLSLHEAFLLQLGIDALEASSQPVSSTIRESLRAKVRSLLPAPLRTEVDAIMATVETRSRRDAPKLPHFDSILTAIQGERWLRVEYTSMERHSTQQLFPRKLSIQDGFWYLNAYSHERGEERTYRVDRISHVSAAQRLSEALPTESRPAFGDPSLPEAIITLTHRGVMEVERTCSWAVVRRTETGGELRLRCPPDEYRWLSRLVLGLSCEARVVSPPELVQMVHRTARDVLEMYEHPKNK